MKQLTKEFLKPNKKKVFIFLVLVISSISVFYILFKMSGYILMCFTGPCSELETFYFWFSEAIGLLWFILLIIIEYLISCWIARIKNK